jgi:type IV pilus assembly protein PilW
MYNNRGFSLIELMMAMAISGIVIGSIFMTYRSQQKSYTAQEQITETQQTLRASIAIMNTDIRMAGFDPSEDLDASIITISTVNALTFTRDDGTGGLDTYSFSYDPIYSTLDRAVNGSGNQTLAENIEAVGLAYAFDTDGNNELDTYNTGGTRSIIWAIDSDGDNDLDMNLDTDGNGVIDENDGPGAGGNGNIGGRALIDFSGTPIADVETADIRAVRIWLLASTRRSKKNYVNTVTYTIGNQVITPVAPNNNHPMRVADTTVKCRNMGL